ncbi:hypothetical protein [Tenacibaculum maritimum]|uniref:hypothetical protein n=1 Tax=Tenacibaculum maritimum TaxID=107401 RepID=UPI001330C74E|nr:hypothetical protein [Tenacibaculum maritimum]
MIPGNEKHTSEASLKTDTISNQEFEKRKVELTCNWMLIDGWFPEQNLSFKRIDKTNQCFKFNHDGTIDYIMPNGFGDCPVGVFTLREGTWSRSEQYLTIELKGLKISDYWYWWKVKYRIKVLSENALELEVIKVIKKKEIDPTLTWEDLVK